MKKLLAVCLCAGLMFTAGGCGLKNITEKLHINEIKDDVNTAIHKSDSETDSQPEISPEPSRVYMDEMSGILQDFSGSTLTMSTSDGTYVFDVSQASLECKDGVVTGDEISIIYEGQLTGTDTGSVRVLKVVDEYHPKSKLKDRTVRGKVLSLTPNTITIKKKSGSKVTYSITGTKQYYSSGIKKGVTVYLHFKGKVPETDSQDEAGSDTSHLKILSISDVDPFDIPAPTPTPALDPEQPVPDTEKEQHFMATV